jgi:hypothetical protein
MGIIAYYTGHYQEAFEFSSEAYKHCPPDQKERIKKNMDFARKNL